MGGRVFLKVMARDDRNVMSHLQGTNAREAASSFCDRAVEEFFGEILLCATDAECRCLDWLKDLLAFSRCEEGCQKWAFQSFRDSNI